MRLGAVAASLLVGYKEPCSREAYEHVDHSLDIHRGAYKHVYDVPVAATGEHAKAYKAPVKAAYGEQDKRDNVKCFHYREIYRNELGGSTSPACISV